jgi:hypothetical protein
MGLPRGLCDRVTSRFRQSTRQTRGFRKMRHAINDVLQSQAANRDPARVSEVAIAPDGCSFSIVAGPDGRQPAELWLDSEEIPRLIVALLRTAELSQRTRWHDLTLVFPIEKGSITRCDDEFIFTVSVADGANMSFQLDAGSAAGLLQALTAAFQAPTQLRSVAH